MEAPAPAPVQAPASTTTTATAHAGTINHDDINDWKQRFNEVLSKPEAFTAPGAAGAGAWHNGFFDCFNPIDTCLITCCCPCVTFGKAHHRTRKNASMEGYSAVNTSCLGFWATMYCGLHWIPQVMQRSDIRSKYNLEGSMLTDCLRACCCGCCDLIQQEKEAAFREAEKGTIVHDEYQKPNAEMKYQA